MKYSRGVIIPLYGLLSPHEDFRKIKQKKKKSNKKSELHFQVEKKH